MKNIDTPFSPQDLQEILARALGIATDARLVVAYSGGLDSHVLLHGLCALRAARGWRVEAVHIDHGLQPASGDWAGHCRRVCETLAVACAIERIEVRGVREEGLESAARRARYAALARHIGPGDVLLTAHHQDDQAETVLLQLLRGAGLAGLAAMPPIAAFAAGRHARPLLGFTRSALATYARQERLSWIEDTSNRDTRLARNFLRHRLLPLIAERWPTAPRQLARTARHAAEAAALLEELAAADLADCGTNAGEALAIDRLMRYSPARQRNLIRHWLRTRGFRPPTAMHLERILAHAHRPPRTRHAAVGWPGVQVRRYRDALFVLPAAPAPDRRLELPWDPPQPLEIAGTGWRLHAVATTGAGLSQERLRRARVVVGLRRGGERCRLPGRAHRHTLKKLLQDAGVPPWERERLPLIYADDELAAVGDRWICEPFCARTDEPGWVPVLERAADSAVEIPQAGRKVKKTPR